MNMKTIKYVEEYLLDYGFESVMVTYRQKLLLEHLNQKRPNVVVEVGCGKELLYEAWCSAGGRADCWLIVEPAEPFSKVAKSSGLANLHVIQDFFENAVGRVKSILPRAPDMVICSALLHEVPSPSDLLAAIKSVMGCFSRLHINVPNSESLHRRLAKSMGLIGDTKAISNRNALLQQNRVYDMRSLQGQLAVAGFNVISEGGYLVKPFTHGQMEEVLPTLGGAVMDGLFELGREFPDLASEIWVEAVLGGNV